MRMNANSGKDTAFETVVMGGNVPSNYIPAVEKGFYEVLKNGTLSDDLISGVRMVLRDGAFHAVDSSELVFSVRCSSRQSRLVLEPIMTMGVVASVEFQSALSLPLFPPSCPFGNQIDYLMIAHGTQRDVLLISPSHV